MYLLTPTHLLFHTPNDFPSRGTINNQLVSFFGLVCWIQKFDDFFFSPIHEKNSGTRVPEFLSVQL